MDSIDIKILDLMQTDASLSTAEIAEKVGLSTSPCWRRIQHLEKSGFILGQVALLDPEKMNVGVDVFVSLKTNQHNQDWLEEVAEKVSQFPEVTEFYRMSGEIDYLMRVVVPDIAAYDAFYKRLVRSADFADVSSSFAMERIKYTTAIPTSYVNKA